MEGSSLAMASKLEKMKRSGAIAGACSALAMGIFGGSLAVQHEATFLSDDPHAVQPSQDMTTEGQTITNSTAPPTLKTSFATPGITTTPTSVEPG
jgi:hypothetical protein